MTPTTTTVDRVSLPKVTPSAEQYQKAVDQNPVEALPRIEAARRALQAELDAMDDVRKLALVRCKDNLGMNASALAEIIGMPTGNRRERDSSASRVRQILIEARSQFGMSSSASRGGRPPVYEDRLTKEFLEAALAAGKTYVEIAAECNVGPATVSRYVDRYDSKGRDRRSSAG